MFIICVPNITHDYINIISDEYNINIDKSNSIFIHDLYLYKINMTLTSGVSYKVKSNNTEGNLISPYIDINNNNYILMYPTMYDTGFSKIYHDNNNNIIIMIMNKVIEVTL